MARTNSTRGESNPPRDKPPKGKRSWLYRRRWQLTPLAVAAGVYLLAVYVTLEPAAFTIVAVLAGGFLLVVRRSKLRDEEKLYARSVIAGAAAWIFAASWLTPWSRAAIASWLLLLLAAWWPWYRHHRIRSRVRVDALIEAWPAWTAAAGIPGPRIVSATAGRAVDRLQVELVRGRQTAAHLAEALVHMASVKGIPAHWIRLDMSPTRQDPGRVDVLVTHVDPWRDPAGRPLELTHPAAEDLDGWMRPASCVDPARFGVDVEGGPASVQLRTKAGGRFLAVVSAKGGGKSVTVNCLLAAMAPMEDLDIVVLNHKEHGKGTEAWEARLLIHATTPGECVAAARWTLDEIARRGADSPDPVLQPTSRRRALAFVVDEYGALVALVPEIEDVIETIVRTHRSAGGPVIIVDQHVDGNAWSGALRGQVDEVLVGRMQHRRFVRAILPNAGEVDPSEFDQDMHGQLAQQAGKTGAVKLVRSWLLEDPELIEEIADQGVELVYGPGGVDRVGLGWDPSPESTSPHPNASRSTRRGELDLASTLDVSLSHADQARLRAAMVRDRIAAVLDGYDDEPARPAPLTRDQLRKIDMSAPRPVTTPDDHELDVLILEKLQAAGAGGLGMAELVAAVGEYPRSTVQMRCSTLARQTPQPVRVDPPRGRHARWYITTERETANA